MAGLVDKLMHFIGLEEEEDVDSQSKAETAATVDDGEYDPMPPRRTHGQNVAEERRRKAPVVSLHGDQTGNMRVMVMEPLTFEEVMGIADHLKRHRPVVLNLEDTAKEVAQRILDFLLGATYALDGGMHRISAGVFLFTPPNVQIDQANKEEMGIEGLLSSSGRR